MSSSHSSPQFQVRYLKVVSLLTGLVLLVFNLGSWLLYVTAINYLDQEMGKRLTSIAATAAIKIEASKLLNHSFLASDRSLPAQLSTFLQQVKILNQLDAVFIFDENNKCLFDTRYEFPKGKEYLCLEQDKIMQAWSGIASASELHYLHGQYFKSGYASLKYKKGVPVAVLCVEASIKFLAVLDKFKKILILAGVISLVLAILFGIFLYKVISWILSTQKTLQRAERFAMIGQVSAGIAHQIRNPLAIIRTSVDVLKRKLPLPEHKKPVEYIIEEVNRLDGMINEFLTFSKETPLKLTSGNITSFLSTTLDSVEQELAEKGIKITREYSNLPIIQFDSEHLRQALLNIILNAEEVMKNGGILQVKGAVESKNVVISISDTGVGIPPEALNRVFEPFYSTRDSGYGLGLAIASQIIEGHSGKIKIKSKVGEGTTFKIILPIEGNYSGR